jgi:chloramphenicol-sensitive protein RarD
MMLPLAIGYWCLIDSPTSNFAENPLSTNALFVLAGIVTTAPLLCFTAAAKRLLYSTLGFFQYIGPSIMFVLAVVVYNEPFNIERIITFGFVWAGLAVFTFDALRQYRRTR